MADAATGTELAGQVLARIRRAYEPDRNPARARAMASYMRDHFAFLGIPAPRQRLLARNAVATLPRPTEDDLAAVATACWALPEREYQYFACGYLRRHVRICSAGFLATVGELITEKPWWDTVDMLAAHVVGGLVARHPPLRREMDAWILSRDPWLVRSALLHQLHYRETTDTERLFRYCTDQAANPDFFVRKAIGWVLREYAKTDPEAVRRYVAAHRGQMSPLSVREALKRL
jgi:3-methyladenine DNA glycosylase AlkD